MWVTQIMESLGGDSLWLDRFMAQHGAIVYYWVLIGFFFLFPNVRASAPPPPSPPRRGPQTTAETVLSRIVCFAVIHVTSGAEALVI